MKRRTVALLVIMTGGCASKVEKQEPPTNGAYTVNFPSVEAAVAVDTLQVMAFEVTAEDICQQLIDKQKSHQDLPKRLAETKAVAICDFSLAESKEGTKLPLQFGRRALLVVARRGADDFLLGCAMQEVARTPTPTVIDVGIVPGTRVPPTTCASLSQRCGGGC